MISAVVPVKALAESKSRLAGGNRQAIANLSLAMMGDVIGALLKVSALDRVGVITPDPGVATAARDFGAFAILRDDPGLNAAIEAGARALVRNKDDAVLVVLGDVAAATPEDLATLLSGAQAPGIVLARSTDGGTSALLRTPFNVIPACFGGDSAKRHIDAAAEAGVSCVTQTLASLAIDLDVTADAHALLKLNSLGARTREALEALLNMEDPCTESN